MLVPEQGGGVPIGVSCYYPIRGQLSGQADVFTCE